MIIYIIVNKYYSVSNDEPLHKQLMYFYFNEPEINSIEIITKELLHFLNLYSSVVPGIIIDEYIKRSFIYQQPICCMGQPSLHPTIVET